MVAGHSVILAVLETKGTLEHFYQMLPNISANYGKNVTDGTWHSSTAAQQMLPCAATNAAVGVWETDRRKDPG